MTKTATITRFHPDGATGLAEWEKMDYDTLVAGEPVQRGHLYHEIESEGYMVGVWDCTAFTERMMPYPVDEYMFFLKGDLTMVLPDGSEIDIQAGDAFVIPKGFMCQWRQKTLVHKYFMILDGHVPEAKNRSLSRITVPDLGAMDMANGVSASRQDFQNAAGTMDVSVESFDAMSQPSVTIDKNALLTVLEGKLDLGDGEAVHSFQSGDTAYIRQGGRVSWATSAGTRIISAGYANMD